MISWRQPMIGTHNCSAVITVTHGRARNIIRFISPSQQRSALAEISRQGGRAGGKLWAQRSTKPCHGSLWRSLHVYRFPNFQLNLFTFWTWWWFLQVSSECDLSLILEKLQIGPKDLLNYYLLSSGNVRLLQFSNWGSSFHLTNQS